MLMTEQRKDTHEVEGLTDPFDPALEPIEFHLRRQFFPMGFPVVVETNREEILDAAEASWQSFSKLFETAPVRIRCGVRQGRSAECPPAPEYHTQDHRVSVVADAENFAVADIVKQTAEIWLTENAVAHPSYVRYFFLEAAALINISTSHAVAVHAACIARNGAGILLCGDSGAGKTSLAYAAARAGWTYITDDASWIVNGRTDRLVVGKYTQLRFRPSALTLFSELDGRNVIQRAQTGKPSIEVATQPLRNISTSPVAHARHIVFLNRQDVRRQELVRYSKPLARKFMLSNLCSLPEQRKLQTETVDTLLEDGAFELRYSDLDWAIERLSLLADKGQ